MSLLGSQEDAPAQSRWQNWAGTQECSPSGRVRAQSVEEVRDAVSKAAERGTSLRVVGAGHSFGPLVCTDGIILDVSAISGVRHVDAATYRARVGAGTLIASLGDPLWERGCSLINQGDIDTQTIAGALSTATHGSGLEFGSLSSSLTRAELVTPTGELLVVEEDDPLLDAVRTSIGCLGVLTEVELQLMPAYQLVEHVEHWPLAEVFERWAEETRTRRHFSFFWGPYKASLELYDLPPAPAHVEEACYVKRYDAVAADAAGVTSPTGRVDRAYRIYADDYPPGWDELEYFVPYDVALEAIEAVRPVLARFPAQRFPVEVRTIAAESGLLSPAYGRPSVALSFSGAVGTDYEGFLRGIDAALREFGARAHWGKTHFHDAERLREVYPRYEDFVAIRRSMDPDGIFLNELTRAMMA